MVVENPRVLVADDDPCILSLVKTVLEIEGFSVLSASNGREALREVEDHRPDVVLLDVMMPVMDGVTCCKELRKNPETATTPIVIMSAALNLAELKETGADGFIAKPFDNDELVSLLMNRIQERKQQTA